MTRLLADTIVAGGAPADRIPNWARWTYDALRLADRNHVPSDGDRWRGAVDRFVFDADEVRKFQGAVNGLETLVRDDLVAATRPPLSDCWIECSGSYSCGFHLTSDARQVVVWWPGDRSAGQQFLPIAVIYPMWGDGVAAWGIEPSPLLSDVQVRWLLSNAAPMNVFVSCLLMLSQPRAATVRRIAPSQSRILALTARRRAQRGKPLFSYNRVALNVPGTSVRRGEDAETVNQSLGVRAHQCRGHWRLILHHSAGELRPEWTWVAGHERGDPALGRVVKERHVAAAAQSEMVRRGYLLPDFDGMPGARVPAVPARV